MAMCSSFPVTLAAVDPDEVLRILMPAPSDGSILIGGRGKLNSCHKPSRRAVRACEVTEAKVQMCVVSRIA
jgi:hypothetical protein